MTCVVGIDMCYTTKKNKYKNIYVVYITNNAHHGKKESRQKKQEKDDITPEAITS